MTAGWMDGEMDLVSYMANLILQEGRLFFELRVYYQNRSCQRYNSVVDISVKGRHHLKNVAQTWTVSKRGGKTSIQELEVVIIS